MPYTPPSASQSPASSRTSTPALSRNQSYVNETSFTSNHAASVHRPSLPRSLTSTAYLSKSRRSPAFASPTDTHPPQMHSGRSSSVKDAESLASLRQSPPPVNNNVIPTGAIISPPDSSENSDGDESNQRKSRRKEVESTWNELQQAVRSMSLKRETSPAKSEVKKSTSEPTTSVASPNNGLSVEARKITHSRSNTETAIVVSKPKFQESTSGTSASEDSDEEDDGGHFKPPLVRKKSGELVKPALRPSSRRRYSSMPGTPTYNKSVHFNDNGNQTRHFLMVDKPSAVSANTSPTDTAYESENEFPFDDSNSPKVEWDIKLANFPQMSHERQQRPVWLEKLYLSSDKKSLVGQVAVANISFQKAVYARFTLDYWKTTSEVTAEFSHDVRRENADDGYDRFNFSIRLADQANLESKTLLLCIRYAVSGTEFWDSNDNTNYQVDFAKSVTKARQFKPVSSLGARPVNAIPRSRHSPPASRGRARAPSFDEDHDRHDNDAAYHFGTTAKDLLGEDSQSTIKLKPRTKRSAGFSSNTTQQAGGLGGRYDFSASLSAALSNAQDKLGKQSGLMTHQNIPKASSPSYFSAQAQPSPMERPDHSTTTTERPAIGSAQYKDLVSKFCYFTPATTGKLSPLPGGQKPAGSDGTEELEPYNNSGNNSPMKSPLPEVSSQLDGANDGPSSSYISPYTSRSASPAGTTRVTMGSRSHSSSSFGYLYHKRDGYLADSPTPTAIRG